MLHTLIIRNRAAYQHCHKRQEVHIKVQFAAGQATEVASVEACGLNSSQMGVFASMSASRDSLTRGSGGGVICVSLRMRQEGEKRHRQQQGLSRLG